MKRQFLLKIENSNNEEFYFNHRTFHKGDCGLDLFIKDPVTIPPGETVLVDLGVRCQSRSFNWCIWNWIRGKFYRYHSYMLVPRSSISKTPLMMRNSVGIIDKGYTGTLKAPFYNTSSEPYYLQRGNRCVQLVNGDMSDVHFKIVDSHRQTSRGTNGFGSTGF